MLGFAIGTLVLFCAFGVLERLFPERAEQRRFRAGFATDALYWLAAPLVNRVLVPVAAALGVVLVSLVSPRPGAALFASWPPAVQVLAVLVVGDFVGYWTHRLFHARPLLWRIHAVHHSSRELDWLSSVRVHPLNQMIQVTARLAILFGLGFEPRVLAAYVPFLTLYAVFIHANVPWRFGWLGYVVASPAWHRWHHAADALGQGRNFAGLLPLWDWLFGTAWFPPEPAPVYGLSDQVVPDSFWRQLAYPFRAR